MNPEQKRLLEKAERSLQAAVELNQKGFAEYVKKSKIAQNLFTLAFCLAVTTIFNANLLIVYIKYNIN
jgi:hypothetical protein